MKKLTVVITAYNMENYIENCLDSVLKSTVIDQIQIYVITGISSDNTDKIVMDFVNRYNNIILYKSDVNDPAYMRNIGLKSCNTEFVSFLDCDDYIENCTYEYMLDENFDITCCSYQDVNISNEILEKHIYQENKAYISNQSLINYALGKINGEVWNKIYRVELLKKFNIMFDSNYGIYGEDLLFNWQCAAKGFSIKTIEDVLYNHTIEGNSISRKKNKFGFTDRIIYILKQLSNELCLQDKKVLEVYSQIVLTQFIDNIIILFNFNITEKSVKEVANKYFTNLNLKNILLVCLKSEYSSKKRKMLCIFLYFHLFIFLDIILKWRIFYGREN